MSSFSDTGTLQHWIGEQCGDSKSILPNVVIPSIAAITHPPEHTTIGKIWLL
jgi:hypothetical protein